ncbi:amino acid/amide ABC transporter substrate-binding protein, HAAT family [Paracoccus alcaliphilus]|uniref:Amino acid/amide ABC transporter substrate-binding protein, HAAT family n=1 Tax=Paracoccus alcaliphilus TaxID=34002 RepID=A0A1H8LSB3_9RHOB|nr:ABC transporter substrate-binding protein [Paracoccus alcaliphilus]SEO08027.1 amino acid/amide ABC transporter substrate-binding protein, HAAT family [Paracoccus alcaliphilus]
MMLKGKLGAGLCTAAILVTMPALADDIVIGASLSLTGVQAPLDEPGLKGAEVAVKYLNDNGGILGQQVKLINIDGKSDPITVGNNTIQLLNNGAELIIAPCDFDFGGPASREAQSAGFVGISTCASDPLYSSWSLGDKQFTLSMWNTAMGATAAEFAYKDKDWKTAYVVTDQFLAYTKSLSRYFVQHYKDIGGEVLAEDSYTQGDQDFSAQLARLQALPEQPDVIFISSYMPDLGTIIRAIREVGITAPIVGGDSYDDPSLIESLGGKFGNDIYFVTHTWMGSEAHPKMEEFIELYKAYHGAEPDTSFVATGWDTVMMMAQGVEAAGSVEGAAVALALEEGQFDLLTGNLDYSDAASGHMPTKAAAVVELQGGEPAFVGWKTAESQPAP